MNRDSEDAKNGLRKMMSRSYVIFFLWWFFHLVCVEEAWAGARSMKDNSSFYQPYVYKDNGRGGREPEFSIKRSGLLPDWISLGVQQRIRYEMLTNQFRAGSSGNDQVLSFRTLAQANLRLHPQLNLHLELQDSRQELADSGTNLTTAIVNSAELLEANIYWFANFIFRRIKQFPSSV